VNPTPAGGRGTEPTQSATDPAHAMPPPPAPRRPMSPRTGLRRRRADRP
jgi:hypothetical protein